MPPLSLYQEQENQEGLAVSLAYNFFKGLETKIFLLDYQFYLVKADLAILQLWRNVFRGNT